ncbi:unnamed protein product [Tuber melanosporum]|uniref:(Perigord truffle) hypothetical protein n=1 Tax=Tuber melanosporum (strain Mel28) TaxID=656061 RepID=D5G5I0_TUBMM|nr:uncharacterized protein GSTUM_00004344001 [Tuber melanosporum]CAZ79773.1 unnamed protein product [Tuber melanosporum]
MDCFGSPNSCLRGDVFFSFLPSFKPIYSGTKDAEGQITTSILDGPFAGAVRAGYLSDVLGLKHALLVTSIVWAIGSVVTLSA